MTDDIEDKSAFKMSNMDEFWKIELDYRSSKSNDTHFLVPQRNDEIRLSKINETETPRLYNKQMSIIKSIDDDIKNGIYLQTIEQKSEGVFDLIGGELWEASLLLCSYILSKPDDFTNSSCLELGAGVALPSLLLTKLKIHKKKISSDKIDVVFTDYEHLLLDNIEESINIQFELAKDANSDIPNTKVSIDSLDWIQPPSELPLLNRLDKLIGSALIYSPDHHNLADIIRKYLLNGCKEVIIIQMHHRAGFEDFVQKLLDYKLDVKTEKISPEIYEIAQKIQAVSAGSMCIQSKNTKVNISGHDSDLVTKTFSLKQTYFFPPEILTEYYNGDEINKFNSELDSESQKVSENIDNENLPPPPVVWRWGGVGKGGVSGQRDKLIKSDIDLFVILTITNGLVD